ncbi:MAG: hypothetical protein HYX24_01545 [Candidatus Aenigmarchaeota archaeon]|nr:hypothetical protein [Candidatus Aenigmarchaeota archaeon]
MNFPKIPRSIWMAIIASLILLFIALLYYASITPEEALKAGEALNTP